MKPILEDMGAAYQGKAIVMTVDMDANKDLVRNFRVRMMPTQVFLAPDGKEFFRNEGTLERNQIAYVFSKMGLPEITPGARPAQALSGRRSAADSGHSRSAPIGQNRKETALMPTIAERSLHRKLDYVVQ